MELNECLEKMKVLWEQDRPFRTEKANEVYQTLISFCESALKLQGGGIPKKKETEINEGYKCFGENGIIQECVFDEGKCGHEETKETCENYRQAKYPDIFAEGYNSCHDEWTAWMCKMKATPGKFYGEQTVVLTSKINKENIIKVMDNIKYRGNWQGIPVLSLGEIMVDEDIQRLAEAIVKDILGEGVEK